MDPRAREVRAEYLRELDKLSGNSKPIISFLAILAEDHMAHAEVIATLLEQRIRAQPGNNLHYLYLVDCILKTVGQRYSLIFASKIYDMFRFVVAQADEDVRRAAFHVRSTWTPYLPPDVLEKIDRYAATIMPRPAGAALQAHHPAYPPAHQPPPPTHHHWPPPPTGPGPGPPQPYHAGPPPSHHPGPPGPGYPPQAYNDPYGRPLPPVDHYAGYPPHGQPPPPHSHAPPGGYYPPPDARFQPPPAHAPDRPPASFWYPPASGAEFAPQGPPQAPSSSSLHDATVALQRAEAELNSGRLDPRRRRDLEEVVYQLKTEIAQFLGPLVPPAASENPPAPSASSDPRDPRRSQPAQPSANIAAHAEPANVGTAPVKVSSSGFRQFKLTDDDLRSRIEPTVIEALYDAQPLQCQRCGLRQPADQQEVFNRHMDWHFRQNQRRLEKGPAGQFRGWTLAERDWISWISSDESAESRMQPPEAGSVAAPGGAGGGEKPRARCKVDGTDRCPVCGDEFETVFDDEEEAWMYLDAVSTAQGAVHELCLGRSGLISPMMSNPPKKIKQ